MPLSPEAILKIRGWIGSEPVDADLQTLFELYKNHDQVVLHVLRARKAELSLEAGSITVPGLSVSHSSDLQAVTALISSFEATEGLGLDAKIPARVGVLSRRYPR